MVRMFPAVIRFTGISFSYNVAYAIVGAITLPLVQWLNSYSPIGAVYYIMPLCLIGAISGLLFIYRYRK